VWDNANILSPAWAPTYTNRLPPSKPATALSWWWHASVPSLQGYEIEDYGYRLGRAWGIGQAEKNNGAVFLVAPTERRVRIEVGYGLEPVLTDAMSSVILQARVLPRFREGDMEGGVVAGVNGVIEQLSLDPAVARQRVAEAQERRESGGGVSPLGGLITALVIFWIPQLALRRLRPARPASSPRRGRPAARHPVEPRQQREQPRRGRRLGRRRLRRGAAASAAAGAPSAAAAPREGGDASHA
jgi:uncharacterized protein